MQFIDGWKKCTQSSLKKKHSSNNSLQDFTRTEALHTIRVILNKNKTLFSIIITNNFINLFIIMMLGQIIGVASMANFDVPLFRFVTIVGLGISSGCFATLLAVALPCFLGRAYLGSISGFQMMII